MVTTSSSLLGSVCCSLFACSSSSFCSVFDAAFVEHPISNEKEISSKNPIRNFISHHPSLTSNVNVSSYVLPSCVKTTSAIHSPAIGNSTSPSYVPSPWSVKTTSIVPWSIRDISKFATTSKPVTASFPSSTVNTIG